MVFSLYRFFLSYEYWFYFNILFANTIWREESNLITQFYKVTKLNDTCQSTKICYTQKKNFFHYLWVLKVLNEFEPRANQIKLLEKNFFFQFIFEFLFLQWRWLDFMEIDGLSWIFIQVINVVEGLNQ